MFDGMIGSIMYIYGNHKRNENGFYDWFAIADELANNSMHTKYNIHREDSL